MIEGVEVFRMEERSLEVSAVRAGGLVSVCTRWPGGPRPWDDLQVPLDQDATDEEVRARCRDFLGAMQVAETCWDPAARRFMRPPPTEIALVQA